MSFGPVRDLVSAAMSVIAVLAAIFALKEIAQGGFSWLPAGSILVGQWSVRC